LYSLLDSGSTALVRNTAAAQLADIQKAHPDELFNLLNRVVPHLRSKTWETRVAATKAIAGIVDNAEKWKPNAAEDDYMKDEIKTEPNTAIKSEDDQAEKEDLLPTDESQLSLDTLDLTSVLKFGKTLLGSSGKEYDYSLADLDPAERLAAQKRNVTARLGLGGEYMEDEIVSEKDFAALGSHTVQTPRIDTSVGYAGRPPLQSPAIKTTTAMSPMEPPPSIPQTSAEDGMSNLSKRQINALKRKAKANAKNHANKVRVVDLGGSRRMSTDVSAMVNEATPHPVKTENGVSGQQQDYFSLGSTAPPDDTKIVVEHKGPAQASEPLIQTSGEEMDWPFERLCEILMVDLFDPNWEIRHGAAMGLREVVRAHGAGAGRVRGKCRKDNDVLNRRWLDDLACRLTCIFMLDRFGDYVSDNVSSPERSVYWGMCMLTE
jgi:TATA-binding protein-associated factor